ncbi:MAG: DNA translocase FtsK [Bacteroidales bacterium]|nr:DNA translocase FtsK [Bacteroidales bacterium]
MTAKPKRKTSKSKKKKPIPIKKRIQNKVQDKKFRTYWGLFFILLSVLLLISFSSSLSTWEDDQDIIDLSWFDYLFNSSTNSENVVGKFGALLSHVFVYNWFGVASFAFTVLFFIIGLKFLKSYKKSLLPVTKKIFFSVFWISICLALLFNSSNNDVVYGKFGFRIHEWFKSILGIFGEITVLLISLFAFLMLTIEGFSSKLKALFDKIFQEGKLSEKFKNFKDGFIAGKDDDEIIENNKKTINKKETVLNDNKEGKEKAIIIDLDDEDENEDFVTTDKRNYKLLDSGKEITDQDDLGFEVEQIKQTENNDIKKDTQENISEYINKEINKIEVGQLVLDVTHNQDILSEKIHSNVFTNYDPTLDLSNFVLPDIDLLEEHQAGNPEVTKEELLRNKNRIVETLKHYKIEIKKIKATIGPTLTLYEIVPAPGVRISKIKNLEDDIALSLAAFGIRIIAPMPGRGTIGIEVPNEKPDIVSFKSVIKSTAFQESKMEIPIALGKTISNESYVFDLVKMPHMLIAGATGQGKSVGLNVIIASILYKKHPAQVKFVLVDPKKVELTLYESLENHYLATLPDAKEPIITNNQEVVHTVSALNVEMDNRYQLLKKAKCKNIKEYNKKFISRQLNPENGHQYMPYIVLVIDEFADLIMTAGKEIELPIARLAQLARAIGIHLIVATQRPSTNIITGTIKANFPSRVAFRVASMIDSRTILDSPGANRLIGRGDMLITQGSDMIRLQCAFIDSPELEKITDYISKQQSYPMPFLLPEPEHDAEDEPGAVDLHNRDELFEESAKIIVMNQQGSTSMIQRKLAIGYNRAGRIVDQLEAAGVVGPSKGSKARDVYITDEYALQTLLDALP